VLNVEIRDLFSKGGPLDALVVFVTQTDKKKPSFEHLPETLRSHAHEGGPAEAGTEGVTFTLQLVRGAVAKRLYAFGVGTITDFPPRKARALLRNVVKTLARNGEKTAFIHFPFAVQRMAEGEARDFLLRSVLLGDYAFQNYKTADKSKSALTDVAFTKCGLFEAAGSTDVADAAAVAAVARLVRDLGNTPSNDLVPKDFAEHARKAAKGRNVAITVLDKKAIVRERMGGLLAVNRGATEEPRFVIAEYKGGKKGEKPVVLVGKGVTFDSGGISIKPAERMGDMKWDMMGAATVLGAVLAAADLKLPINVVGLTPLTENMPSGSAYKPGDIVTFRNGKTAEIDNTDAEGRVILADALDYAAKWKPQVIVDYATLTGAALVALGLEAAIVFTADDALAAELISAGERTDERIWRLPLWDDYKENIKSEWADVKNTGGRYGGSINGAMFLKEFVPEGVPWAHLDIAPTAYFEREYAGYPVGATAFGVAMTIRWLRDRLISK